MIDYMNSILPQIKDSLLVFGSRTLSDERVNKIISDYVEANNIKHIITSYEPDGVCKVARELYLHKMTGITIILMSKDSKRAAGMYEDRSRRAIMAADKILFIWDGSSKGTLGEMRLAKKMNRKYEMAVLEKLENAWDIGKLKWEEI